MDDEGGSYDYPCLAILALSKTCKALRALLEPFLERPRLRHVLLDFPASECSLYKKPTDQCRERKRNLQECANADAYFHYVRWLQLDFWQDNMSDRLWAALAKCPSDEDRPIILWCSDCDFLLKKLVQHLQGPAPLPSLIGLHFVHPNSHTKLLQPSIDIIEKVFWCPKLRFLKASDEAVLANVVYMPKVSEYLTVSLNMGAFLHSGKTAEYYNLVPHPVLVQVELFNAHRWLSEWHRSIRRIHIHGGNEFNQMRNFLKVSTHAEGFFVSRQIVV